MVSDEESTMLTAITDRSNGCRVLINISGEIFESFEGTLARFPTSLLGNKRVRNRYYCSRTKQHFFERNRLCFESILYFYQSNGTLNCPFGISIDVFEQECCFFKLPNNFIDAMKRREGIFTDLLKPRDVKIKHLSFQQRIWNILENPSSSQAAWNFGLASMTIVILSIFTASLETIKTFESPKTMWSGIELSINIWFLVEYILRMVCCENKMKFLTGYMNMVDIAAVVPYFVILFMQSNALGSLLQIFKTLKFLRVCRLFRFSKHSKRLAVAGKIVQSCLGSFRLLLTCFAIVIVFGGAVLLILEETGPVGNDLFNSVPQGLWWCVQTLTTVGYGDMIPKTFSGRLFASCFMLLGVATISLPILTIVSQFARLYPKNIELVSNSGEEKVGGAGKYDLEIPGPGVRR